MLPLPPAAATEFFWIVIVIITVAKPWRKQRAQLGICRRFIFCRATLSQTQPSHGLHDFKPICQLSLHVNAFFSLSITAYFSFTRTITLWEEQHTAHPANNYFNVASHAIFFITLTIKMCI